MNAIVFRDADNGDRFIDLDGTYVICIPAIVESKYPGISDHIAIAVTSYDPHVAAKVARIAAALDDCEEDK